MTDNRVCRICDGGPGNECACNCGMQAWEQAMTTYDKGIEAAARVLFAHIEGMSADDDMDYWFSTDDFEAKAIANDLRVQATAAINAFLDALEREGPDDAHVLKAGDVAYWRKLNDAASQSPTEHPEDGGGAMGYALRAMLRAMRSPGDE